MTADVQITEVARAQTAVKYNVGAAELLALCRKFFDDPENERAYQEWRREHGNENHS